MPTLYVSKMYHIYAKYADFQWLYFVIIYMLRFVWVSFHNLMMRFKRIIVQQFIRTVNSNVEKEYIGDESFWQTMYFDPNPMKIT